MIAKEDFQPQPLWQGPSKLFNVRTGKAKSLKSLLDPENVEDSGIDKHSIAAPVYLSQSGFENDDRVYPEHQAPDRTVLQYNHRHYADWKPELSSLSLSTKDVREQLLTPGGFGENFAAHSDSSGIFMSEHTMCIGDLIGIFSPDNKLQAAIRVTGPRNPCYKLNHRFGIKNMGQRAQESFRTGWFYSTHKEGYVTVNDHLVLLERPHPAWSVARVQYYMYKDPRNFEMIKQCLDTVGDLLITDIKAPLTTRLTKGLENWKGRLGISTNEPETFSTYQLTSKIRETSLVSSFVFTRNTPYPDHDVRLLTAEPGSHVRLRFQVNAKGQQIQIIRPYSVVSGTTNSFTLGIALADSSRGGSSYLHNLQIGEMVEACDRFANTFPLSKIAERHIFLAGGIGITAFLDHIHHCRRSNIDFEFHYMVRNESDVAYRSLLEKSQTNGQNTNSSHVNTYISSIGHRADISSILSNSACNSSTHIYTCGSEKLVANVLSSAKTLEIDNERLHFEQFTVDASGDPFIVDLAKTKRKVEELRRQNSKDVTLSAETPKVELQIPGDMSLLGVMQDAGFMVPSSCEAGNCGTCRVRVLAGKVEHRGTALLEDEKAGFDGEDGEMLACVSRGVGRICIDW